MKLYRTSCALALALAMASGLAFAQAAPGTITGDNNGCNQLGVNMPNSGDNGNCRNNVSGTNTNELNGGANTAQGGNGSGQATVTTHNVNANRSSFVQTPQSSMAAVTANSGSMVTMTTACGPRVSVGHEHVNGVFFTLMSGQDRVDLGKHDVVRPAADGDVFTMQRIESAKTTLLIGHQVSLSCTRVAVAGQRGFGIGGSSSGGSGALGVQNGGIMETMMCKAAVAGCVAATLADPEPVKLPAVNPTPVPPVAPAAPMPQTATPKKTKAASEKGIGAVRSPRTCQDAVKKTSMVLDTCGFEPPSLKVTPLI